MKALLPAAESEAVRMEALLGGGQRHINLLVSGAEHRRLADI